MAVVDVAIMTAPLAALPIDELSLAIAYRQRVGTIDASEAERVVNQQVYALIGDSTQLATFINALDGTGFPKWRPPTTQPIVDVDASLDIAGPLSTWGEAWVMNMRDAAGAAWTLQVTLPLYWRAQA